MVRKRRFHAPSSFNIISSEAFDLSAEYESIQREINPKNEEAILLEPALRYVDNYSIETMEKEPHLAVAL